MRDPNSKPTFASWRERWVRLKLRLVAAFGVIVLSLVGGIVGAVPANASIGGMCDFGIFISIRGTNANVGSTPLHSGRVWATGGEGLIKGLADKLRYNSDMPFAFYSLNYPATTVGPDYFTSVGIGRSTLVNEINWLAEQCGVFIPSIVLAGHSQGATIAQEVLVNAPAGPNLTTKGRAAISAIAAFGDPNFSPGQPFNAPASASTGGVMGPRLQVYSDQIAAHRFWGWPLGTNTEGWIYRTRSWCFSTDYICAGGSNQTIHNAYDLNFDAAKTWIEYVLTSF